MTLRWTKLLSASFLLVFAGPGCDSQVPSKSEGPNPASETHEAREVTLEPVAQHAFEDAVELSGTLAPDEQVLLATKVAGRLAKIHVDLASAVQEGQVVAQIETTDYDFGVQQARAALGQARAQLGLPPTDAEGTFDPEATAIVRQAHATLEEARVNETRLVALVREGLSPQSELDGARATLVRAEATLESAREEVRLRQAQVRQRESELRTARQRLLDTSIRSPITGFVQTRRANVGEYLAAGAPVAEVVRVNPLRLRLAVPEREATNIERGQIVRVRGEAGDHTGVLARVAPSLDASNRSLLIEADIQNPGTLRPGSFVTARIVTGSHTTIAVSKSSVVTFAGLQKVIVVENDRAVEKPVKTGRVEGDRVEISSGIELGQRVVKNPGSLQQGQAVRVVEVPTKAGP